MAIDVDMSIRAIMVAADANGFVVLPLYGGLRTFARRHSIPLRYAPSCPPLFKQYWPSILWVELTLSDRGSPVSICIDMHDSGSLYSI